MLLKNNLDWNSEDLNCTYGQQTLVPHSPQVKTVVLIMLSLSAVVNALV
jgi:hypothetical protein